MVRVKRVLLDTHALLWALVAPKKLPVTIRKLLENPDLEVYVSSLSAWELAMKYRAGKLSEAEHLLNNFHEYLQEANFKILVFTVEHGLEAANIGIPHGDPYDRGLLAQAKLENLALVSGDNAFDDLSSPKILW